MQTINKRQASKGSTEQSIPTDSVADQLILGNCCLREKRWQAATQAYAAVLRAQPLISLPIAHLLEVSRDEYVRSRFIALRDQPNTASLVEVIDSGIGRLTESPANTEGQPKISKLIIPEKLCNPGDWAWQQVAARPADGVILQGTSMPLVLIGLIYKVLWGSTVLVEESAQAKDKDHPSPEAADQGAATTAQAQRGVSIDDVKKQGNGLPDPRQPHDGLWLQLAIELITRFDGQRQSVNPNQWQKVLEGQRRPVDGAQLTCLEAMAPALASPLMAARFWRWNQERINWPELQVMQRSANLVSIVIPVYGDPGELDACLNSLREAQNEWEWEAIAVMNDTTEASRNVLMKHHNCDARIRAVWPGENVQFALGCNLGFAASRGRWLVLLNNDCRVRSGWLKGLIKPLLDDAVAATQPRLVKPDRTVQSLGVVFHEGQTLGYPLYAGLPADLACVQRPHRLQALTGACLAMRAHDFASVEGLDCRYINSQEDIDLCLRLMKRSGRRYCLSCETSEVIHSEAQAPGRFTHSTWSRHQFVLRWSGRIRADDQLIYSNDNMIVDSFKPDKHEFEQKGIGAGRAVVRTRPRTQQALRR